MECGREGRRRKISGKARQTRPYGKQKAKVRDAFSCQICGFDLVVHAHHIVPVKNGGSNHLSNLITLCPNHHAMAHAGLLSIEEMTKAILSAKNHDGNLKIQANYAINYRAASM
jgi:predicted HNH restriction endonuclease